VEEALTEILNQYAKPIKLSPFSKRWWSQEIKEARRDYAQARRAWKTGFLDETEYREARNTFYRTIRQAKRECWETFLEGPQGTEAKDNLGPDDTARCWHALRYSGPKAKAAIATPTLIGPDDQVATTLEEKEALVREIAFPLAPTDTEPEAIPQGTMHQEISEEIVRRPYLVRRFRKLQDLTGSTFEPSDSSGTGQSTNGGLSKTMLPPWNAPPNLEDSQGDPGPKAQPT
jgi:hypothetical protein